MTNHQQSPVCARFAHLDWGYEKFSLFEAVSTDARPSLSPLKAEGLSAISASHTYHLCGSINSAALREKSDNQGQYWISTKSDDLGACQCREGLHALPKTMFDLFLEADVTFSADGSFFVEGHEALPCTGYASPYFT